MGRGGRGKGQNALAMVELQQLARLAKRRKKEEQLSLPENRAASSYKVPDSKELALLPPPVPYVLPAIVQHVAIVLDDLVKNDWLEQNLSEHSVAKWIFSAGKRMSSNRTAAEEQRGIQAWADESYELCATVWCISRSTRSKFFGACRASRSRGLRILLIADCVEYDETPMPMRMPEQLWEAARAASPAAHLYKHFNTALAIMGATCKANKGKTTVKLFQQITTWGAVLELSRPGADGGKRYLLTVRGSVSAGAVR